MGRRCVIKQSAKYYWNLEKAGLSGRLSNEAELWRPCPKGDFINKAMI